MLYYVVVKKILVSVFLMMDFDVWFKVVGIDMLIVIGLMMYVCVVGVVCDVVLLGYVVIVVDDVCVMCDFDVVDGGMVLYCEFYCVMLVVLLDMFGDVLMIE